MEELTKKYDTILYTARELHRRFALVSLHNLDIGADKSSKPTSVYVIENTTTGKIKIGIATNVKSRLATLQTAAGDELKVLDTREFENGRDAKEAEALMHEFYSRSRCYVGNRSTPTEWFRPAIKSTVLKVLWKSIVWMKKHSNDSAFFSREQMESAPINAQGQRGLSKYEEILSCDD